MANMLRTFEHEGREWDDNQGWNPFLNHVNWAIQGTFHTTGHTPAHFVFACQHRAKIVNAKLQRSEKNFKQENQLRLSHKYNVGE